MKRDRAITLFFVILRLSPDSVSEKSLGNLRPVANTHNSRPHLASGSLTAPYETIKLEHYSVHTARLSLYSAGNGNPAAGVPWCPLLWIYTSLTPRTAPT